MPVGQSPWKIWGYISMSPRDGVSQQRNAGIDVLRGIAIFMVMLLHFSLTYRLWHGGLLVDLIGRDWTYSLIGWGNFAVTMFFVISGFLIATNTARRDGGLGHVQLRPFYVRRFARLLPCLVLALGIITTLGLCSLPSFAAEGPHPTFGLLLGVLSVLTFCHNILMQHWGYFDYALNVYWSLSVEEVFYILFPIVCLVLKREWLIAIPCFLFIMIAPFYRAAHADNDIFYLYANFACFDAISIGCLTSMLARHWQPSIRQAIFMEVAGWIILVAFWLRGFDGAHVKFSFTVIALSTAAIIFGSFSRPSTIMGRSFPGRGMRWLGRHSYELYLFHIIVLGIMRDIVPGNSLGTVWQIPWLLTFLAISAIVAGGVARTLGDPVNRALRQRFLMACKSGTISASKSL
ncbi:acyltransferase family protein [Novacetimonas pomaceti]|uniref:O-antigen acetylase n=1 Tax=Novacetimonas pomaceti TaxID=2021998 RepID=A0ABX5P2N9_9PROT|nr:O-antigen acetylase [Novacetimonas pomaceti]